MLDSLMELLNKTPFQPFRIVTASGDKYDVENPHLVAVGALQSELFLPEFLLLGFRPTQPDHGF